MFSWNAESGTSIFWPLIGLRKEEIERVKVGERERGHRWRGESEEEARSAEIHWCQVTLSGLPE